MFFVFTPIRAKPITVMQLFTKDNPGTYTDLLRVVQAIEGGETDKVIRYDKIEWARKDKHSYSDMYAVKDGKTYGLLGLQVLKGGIKVFNTASEQLPFETVFDYVYVRVQKNLKDYSVKYEYAGKYKICEGGGWYSNGSLYRLNGNYYAF